ncbi:MAG: L,D-transpeptidase family protein, partial [Chloroflexota bacterium]|nr:L,D-transpeptidase family protein [Chloroflexota bacterium]
AGTPDEVRVSDLGRALALLRGQDIAPVENYLGAETYGPAAPLAPDHGPLVPVPTATPVPVALPAPITASAAQPAPPYVGIPPAAPRPRSSGGGTKSIVVNLSDQWMYAYEGDNQVYDAPVSTGRDGMQTPTGTFSIYAKLKVQTMDGVTDGKKWVVPNVPNVMYINGGVALHGTYWHNRFGTGARLSHGCVNLPLGAASWLYNWAPMGTTVRVTY